MQIRPRLEEGWSTLFLLWAMMLITAVAIRQADLIDGMHIIPLVGTLAIFFGTLLAKSRFSSNTAHLFSFVFGLFFVFYWVATTSSFMDMPWRERMLDPVDGLVVRQVAWLQKLVNGGTSRDGLIFVFQTSLIFWLLGYTATWYTFRRPRVWRAIIPMGLVLLSVVYYYAGPEPLQLYMAIYALFATLFIARTHLAEQEQRWRAGAVRYEQHIWLNFARAGLVASTLALIFAWVIPPLSANAAVSDALSGASGPWREFQDNWTRMFSALRTYGGTTADPYQDTLALGGPRNPGNTPVMDVAVPRELPYVYWQAVVYDTYDDGAWQRPEDDFAEHYPDEGPINTPFTQSREVITQTITSYFPNSSFIYGAPEVIHADLPLNVYASSDANGNQLVSQMRSKFVMQQGDTYEVTSRLSVADATSLRNAGTNYPEWIRTAYLQLPDSITPETIALAEEITAGHDSPFDKAVAIRDYLRENITYNDQIDAVPDGEEPVHYTLFVSQEGYCNYYASAMAVMLRAQGVPARVVSGYAQGTYDEESQIYRVRANNAHTWVEAYFPGYGWIQFEPTASLPVNSRPERIDESSGGDAFSAFISQRPLNREELLGEELDAAEDATDDFLPPELPDANAAAVNEGLLDRASLWQMVGSVLVVGLAIVVSVAANRVNQRVEGDVVRSYGRLENWSRWLGVSLSPAATPHEQADALATAVPTAKDGIRTLTHQYILTLFSPQHQTETDFDPLPVWKQLRPILLKQTLSRQLARLRK